MIAPDDHYLGDGLYARIADGMVILLTERASGVHFVALEPEVFNELIRWTDEQEFGAPSDG
jgi:hypothetical protein